MKKYSFLEIENERFLTEAYVFDLMSKGNKFIYENVPLMIKKFYPGGLTDNQLKIRIESPKGCYFYYKQRHELSKGFVPRIKAHINKVRFYFWIQDKEFKKKNKLCFLDYLLYLPSLLVFLKDRKAYKKKSMSKNEQRK